MIYGIIGNAQQQKFYFEYQPEGFYKIMAMHTGKSITVQNNEIKKGTSIVQYDYQGLDSQKWILRDSQKNGWIISPISNLELAISIENEIQNGSKLILDNENSTDNQMMYIYNITNQEKTKEDGIYKIANGIDSKKVIEVQGASEQNNAIIGIWDYRRRIATKILF